MAKCWRNSEGREFQQAGTDDTWANFENGMLAIPACDMRKLGYELVDAGPVGTEGADEFEVVAASSHTSESTGVYYLASDRLIPGKTYVVREKR